MRIIIENGSYDLGNMGDVAMLQVALSRLHSLWPDAVIEIITDVPEKLVKLYPNTRPLSSIGRQIWFSPLINRVYKLMPNQKGTERLLNVESKLRHYFPSLVQLLLKFKLKGKPEKAKEVEAFIEAIYDADLVVASGGGYISDLWGEWTHEILDTFAFATKLGKPTAILGHGLSPIQDPRLYRKAKSVFPSLSLISLREKKVGLPLLNSMGVSSKRIVTTGDDAIELAYNARNTELKNGIGINLRVADYSSISQNCLEIVRSVLHDIAKKKGAPLVPIPILRYHIYSNIDSDIKTIQQILAGFDDISDGGNNLDTPLKVIKQVGYCRVVVTGSYHAGVFALAQGIPVVGLAKSEYYINKFQGLADQFGVGCEVILLNDEEFAEKLAASINKLWSASEQLKLQLLEAAQRQIHLGQTAYKQLYEIVQHDKDCSKDFSQVKSAISTN